MPPQPKQRFKIETTWIREYARSYLPNETAFSYSAEVLRRMGINLVTVRNVLRSGRVVSSEKLDEPGAIWIVEGEDPDGDKFRLTVKVISEEMDVSLEGAEKIHSAKTKADEVVANEKTAKEEDGGNEAA